ncbi:MAG: glycosyltransferase family 4 protein [Hyphomonas sp.]|nr:glycosyltransferase family 4 protein [Hyphomonas sp.]
MKRPPNVAVAMLGARMHYAVPALLNDANLLAGFFTDSYIGNKPMMRRILDAIPDNLMKGPLGSLAGRFSEQLSPSLVHSDEFLGFWYWSALHLAKGDLSRTENVQAEAARRLAENAIDRDFCGAGIVWGFNTASVELFEAASAKGIRCVLEQTLLPYALETKLLRREARDWPMWQPGFDDPQMKRTHIAREAREWELADYVVGGSAFVADGLAASGVAVERIRTIPYGVDPGRFRPAPGVSQRNPDARLKVLFVGEVGLRKGAQYLLQALAQLGPSVVEARFAGRIALSPDRLSPFGRVAQFLGPIPRLRMPDLYRWADVFVLPSIIEGSATVVYEAILSGLPVVVTPNVGSIVQNHKEGRIVPIRDSDSIARALSDYAENPDILAAHSMAARAAIPRASLTRYRRDLQALIVEIQNA